MAITAPTPASEDSVQASPTRWQKFRERLEILFNSNVAIVGLLLVLFWVIVALFADNCLLRPFQCFGNPDWEPTPLIARYSYTEFFSGARLEGPSAEHWLGTDEKGRDIWARLAFGARPVLRLAPISIIISLFLGGALGVISGYYGGLIDEILMRALDALMAFPQVLLYLVIIAALGPSELNIVLAITIAGIPGIARLVRGLTLDIKTRDYVAAAQTRGENPFYIMLIEILPNASGPIIIDAMLRLGYAIFAIGTLGFLGLGLPPPSPDWGSMVSTGMGFIQAGKPWGALWPALAIASIVVGLNLMADGFNEELNKYR